MLWPGSAATCEAPGRRSQAGPTCLDGARRRRVGAAAVIGVELRRRGDGEAGERVRLVAGRAITQSRRRRRRRPLTPADTEARRAPSGPDVLDDGRLQDRRVRRRSVRRRGTDAAGDALQRSERDAVMVLRTFHVHLEPNSSSCNSLPQRVTPTGMHL